MGSNEIRNLKEIEGKYEGWAFIGQIGGDHACIEKRASTLTSVV